MGLADWLTKINVTVKPNVTVYVGDEEAKDVRVEVEPEATPESTSLDEFLVREKPYYEKQDSEDAIFKTAYEQKFPIMLKGPTGCGKTRFVEYMAHNLDLPLITVSCQEDLSATDLTGRHLLNQQGTYWVDGPLTKAARYGGICYLDEVVEARNDAMVLIHSLTDHRRILPLDRNDEVVEAHPNFMLVVSYNPHYQSVLKKMKESTRQRFVALDFDYPTPDLESKVVAHETGLKIDEARKLVDYATETRKLKEDGLAEGASTRLLIYAGRLLKEGIDPNKVVKNAIAGPLTDDPEMYQRIVNLYRS